MPPALSRSRVANGLFLLANSRSVWSANPAALSVFTPLLGSARCEAVEENEPGRHARNASGRPLALITTVILAMGDGKRAAKAIDHYLASTLPR